MPLQASCFYPVSRLRYDENGCFSGLQFNKQIGSSPGFPLFLIGESSLQEPVSLAQFISCSLLSTGFINFLIYVQLRFF